MLQEPEKTFFTLESAGPHTVTWQISIGPLDENLNRFVSSIFVQSKSLMILYDNI